MDSCSRQLARAVACAAFLAIGLPAQAAKIGAGSGASPTASVTGIYEIAVLTTDAGRRHKVLALVHKGGLWEVHVRGGTGYQRRVAGSAGIRVSPSTFDRLLSLAGGMNRDVNGLPFSTRCGFYRLAGLGISPQEQLSWSCPVPLSIDGSVITQPTDSSNSASSAWDPICPAGTEVRFSYAGGVLTFRCVSSSGDALVPAVQGRFLASLFDRPVSYAWLNPQTTRTNYGVWVFGGFGFQIGWLNDSP